jgi:hypothetical protein
MQEFCKTGLFSRSHCCTRIGRSHRLAARHSVASGQKAAWRFPIQGGCHRKVDRASDVVGHDNVSKIPADVQTLVKQNRDDILNGKLQVPNVPMGQ